MKNITYVAGKQRYAVRCDNPHGAYALMTEVNRRFGRRAEYGAPGRAGYLAISEAEFRAMLAPVVSAAKTEPTPVATPICEEIVNFPVHMVVHTCSHEAHSTIQYKDRKKAAAAYRTAKAQVGSTLISVEAGYRTVTVDFGDGKKYTYLADKFYKTKSVTVETAGGPKKATIVDQKIRSVKELKALADEHGKTIANFFMTIDGRDMNGVYVYRETAEARDMAEAFTLPSAPKTYGYGTYTDDDVPW